MAFVEGDTVWALDPTETNYMKANVEKVIDMMIQIRYIELENAPVWLDYENEHLIPVVKNN